MIYVLKQKLYTFQELNHDLPSSSPIIYSLLQPIPSHTEQIPGLFFTIYLSKYTNKLKAASCIYPSVFNAIMKHSQRKQEHDALSEESYLLQQFHTLLLDVLCRQLSPPTHCCYKLPPRPVPWCDTSLKHSNLHSPTLQLLNFAWTWCLFFV
jgi:hypothetical protein